MQHFNRIVSNKIVGISNFFYQSTEIIVPHQLAFVDPPTLLQHVLENKASQVHIYVYEQVHS